MRMVLGQIQALHGAQGYVSELELRLAGLQTFRSLEGDGDGGALFRECVPGQPHADGDGDDRNKPNHRNSSRVPDPGAGEHGRAVGITHDTPWITDDRWFMRTGLAAGDGQRNQYHHGRKLSRSPGGVHYRRTAPCNAGAAPARAGRRSAWESSVTVARRGVELGCGDVLVVNAIGTIGGPVPGAAALIFLVARLVEATR